MTNKQWVSFDIEIATIVPEGEEDWWAHAPLGISCYALAWLEGDGSIARAAKCGRDDNGNPIERMTVRDCENMVSELRLFVDNGFTILTHNGTSFDWRLAAEESGLHDECVDLALNHHVDTCLLAHCVKGFPVGLDAIAKGMGLSGKTEGIDGAKAPVMWANGEYDEVLEYVTQDCITTLEVALAIEKQRGFAWFSRRGRRNVCQLPMGLITAKEALLLDLPDTSWMTDPISREKFYSWTGVTMEDMYKSTMTDDERAEWEAIWG